MSPRKKKLTPFEMVKEFHVTYGLPIVEAPAHPSKDRIQLRRDLISEEYWEYDRAVEKGDLVNMAQELADILYVVYGAALEYGIPLDEVVAEVHRANMSKLDSDGSVLRREDGKVLKGPAYKAPDIESILNIKEESVGEEPVLELNEEAEPEEGTEAELEEGTETVLEAVKEAKTILEPEEGTDLVY